jgi:hypothetical protein
MIVVGSPLGSFDIIHYRDYSATKATIYSVSEPEPFDESVEVASGTAVMTGTRVKPD